MIGKKKKKKSWIPQKSLKPFLSSWAQRPSGPTQHEVPGAHFWLLCFNPTNVICGHSCVIQAGVASELAAACTGADLGDHMLLLLQTWRIQEFRGHSGFYQDLRKVWKVRQKFALGSQALWRQGRHCLPGAPELWEWTHCGDSTKVQPSATCHACQEELWTSACSPRARRYVGSRPREEKVGGAACLTR